MSLKHKLLDIIEDDGKNTRNCNQALHFEDLLVDEILEQHTVDGIRSTLTKLMKRQIVGPRKCTRDKRKSHYYKEDAEEVVKWHVARLNDLLFEYYDVEEVKVS